MEQFVAGVAVVALAYIIVTIVRWPSKSLAIYLSMFTIEQIFVASGIVGPGSPVVNYSAGAIGVFAAVIGIAKYGIPKLDLPLTFTYFSFLGYCWLSTLWTTSPNAASFALVHFTLEASLAVLLPAFVVRTNADLVKAFRSILLVVCVGAVAVLLIQNPASGARYGIVSGGTILSPAELVGIGVVVLLAANRKLVNLPISFRGVLVLVFFGALFLMGARGQLIFAVLAGLVASILSGTFGRMTLTTSIVGGLTMVGALSFDLLSNELATKFSSAAGRYSENLLSAAASTRLGNWLSCLDSDSPLLGNGVMSWSQHRYGVDSYLYPHNSIAQLYYELGIIGIIGFLFLFGRPLFLGIRTIFANREAKPNQGSVVLLAALVLFEFLISLKQGTFMSCIGLYMFASLLMAYLKHVSIAERKSGSHV